jgi:hypothetical protein
MVNGVGMSRPYPSTPGVRSLGVWPRPADKGEPIIATLDDGARVARDSRHWAGTTARRLSM